MKPGRKRWAEILLALAILAGFAIFFWSTAGPYYQGHSVGYWFNHTNDTSSLVRSTGWAPVPIESENAFRSIGRGAVPYLVAQLAPDSAWTSYYLNHYASWPAWSRRILPPPRAPGARQQRAANLLGAIGPPAQSAVPALIASYNRNWLQRWNQSPGTPLDWPTLLTNSPAWLSTRPPQGMSLGPIIVGNQVTTPLFSISPSPVASTAAPPLRYRPVLGSSYPSVDNSVRTLALIGGTNNQIIPLLLLSARESAPPENVYNAPASFPALAPTIREAEPLLINCLNHSDNFVRRGASGLLRVLVPNHPEVVPPLIKSLKDPDLAVRWTAMHSLGDATNQLDLIVPAICDKLNDQQMRSEAIHVLAGLDNYSPRIVSLLEKSLDDPNSLVRAGVLEALGRMGPMAKAALPRIETIAYTTNEWDREVTYQASLALWNINREPTALVPYRIEDLQSDNDTVRWDAASFLGNIGPAAKPALPALVQTLKFDASPRVRAKAAITLGQLSIIAAETIPDLRDATKDEYQNVRQAAAEALDKIAAENH